MSMLKNFQMIPSALGAAALNVSRSIMSTLPENPSACPPIIFMHGFAGFNEIDVFGIKLLEYWNGIPELLNQMGYQAFTPQVTPFNSPQVRAEQWKMQIEAIRKKLNVDKVMLVAHSQGAIDARLLVCPNTEYVSTSLGPLNGKGYGEHVSKVVTVGGPHFGNVTVDMVDKDPKAEKILNDIFGLADLIARGITGKKQDATAAIAALGQKFMLEEFNPYCVDDPNVEYFCMAGNPKTEKLVSPILKDSFQELYEIPQADGGGANDGFVTVPSALFGNSYRGAPADYAIPDGAEANSNWTVLGTVMADHVVEVGLPLDFPPNKYYDHLACFGGLAQLLDPFYMAEMQLKDNGQWVREAMQDVQHSKPAPKARAKAKAEA
ncbi:Triacylglycerol lipase [BD1-7 clade bacterium]|uniref:Triacylglycerol lipase n=1 Tax=BD1-7 clade bacterium TaxID=2029982 RepID=A0A5S9QZQ5_9GAMM|nr:Triacylglycerol lipase [BD1-7 clade bacterium]